jgi:alanine transaminase
MTVDNMKKIIEFCYNNRIILLADEVYQENIWGNVPFTSFRKVLESMPDEIKHGLHLISFFSVSKGFYGECGKRGGYLQITNIGKFEQAQMYKLASINLCSNVVGQEAVELIVNRPKPGDESYELFEKEKKSYFRRIKIKG